MARKHTNAVLGDIPYTAQEEADQDAFEALPPPPPPTDEERIDEAFPQTDVARVIFEMFFELINRVRTLEGGAIITRAQLKDFIKTKLP